MLSILVDEMGRWVLKAVKSLGCLPNVVDYCIGIRYSYVLIKDTLGRKWLGVAITPLEDIMGTFHNYPIRCMLRVSLKTSPR
ncbi:MAG: DUF4213 domain-containing protein [Thermoprotei archaeon]|nr:DUF4213 domain-containing protein [Thermoprotei archaeon]